MIGLMNLRRLYTVMVATLSLGVTAACSSGSDHSGMSMSSSSTTGSSSATSSNGMGDMHDMDGGPAPAGMTAATNPRFSVGSKVTLTADHMEGMNGAPATVVGAYDTYTYAIDYTPTDGGDPMTDHKWVVQEELEGAGGERLAEGTEVTVNADHMEGMNGATATIASSTDETVYVVDYTADGMEMTNHKWVVESEMQPAS